MNVMSAKLLDRGTGIFGRSGNGVKRAWTAPSWELNVILGNRA